MMKRILLATVLLLPLGVQGGPQAGADAAATAWRSAGKAGAPIALTQTRRYEARVGETFALALDFTSQQPALTMRVEINAHEGLMLDQPRLQFDLGAVPAGALRLPTVNVTALRDGRAWVNVSVMMETVGGTRMRGFSVPVTVGDPSLQARKRTDVATDHSGRAVRVVPGVETR